MTTLTRAKATSPTSSLEQDFQRQQWKQPLIHQQRGSRQGLNTMAGRKDIITAGVFTQYVWALNEPRDTWKMVLNVNTPLLAISVIRVALRGPLEWLLFLCAFHPAGRFMCASRLCLAQTGIWVNVIIDPYDNIILLLLLLAVWMSQTLTLMTLTVNTDTDELG